MRIGMLWRRKPVGYAQDVRIANQVSEWTREKEPAFEQDEIGACTISLFADQTFCAHAF